MNSIKKLNLNYPFYTIGIDIGGTKIAGALLLYSAEGKAPEIIHYDKITAEAHKGCDIFSSNICSIANSTKTKAENINKDIPVVGIGMGSAGRINKDSGKVMTATDNFPGFVGFPLTRKVFESTGIYSFALNDVQSHTYGEAKWGAGKNCDNFILLAVGTGIGGAIVADGKLLMGCHGYAGELGHVQAWLANGVSCTCGKSGHLEAIASGSGMERIYASKTGDKLSGQEISQLANNGNKDAIDTIETAGRCLGQIIAMYLSVFDPEKIILAGSVLKAGKLWKDAVYTGYKEEVIDDISQNLNLIDAQLGDNAALIGASEYALDRLKAGYGQTD